MIQIFNNEIHRGGVKIGWVDGTHIFDRSGKRLGYFSGNDIFNEASSNKIARIEGDYIKVMSDPESRGIRLEDNMKEVSGGTISDACRAAIRLLLG